MIAFIHSMMKELCASWENSFRLFLSLDGYRGDCSIFDFSQSFEVKIR